MSAYLVDSNILLRLSRRGDADYVIIDAALERLLATDAILYYTHQNIAEVWNVFTRPAQQNGFGLPVQAVEREVQRIEAAMVLLPDNRNVYEHWRRLVRQYDVLGVRVHDARLVAAMLAHSVSLLLTLNVADFERYGDEITAVHPRNVIREQPSS